jgi:hypothetical protein
MNDVVVKQLTNQLSSTDGATDLPYRFWTERQHGATPSGEAKCRSHMGLMVGSSPVGHALFSTAKAGTQTLRWMNTVNRETEGFNQYVLVMTDCYLIFVVELSCAPIRIDNDRELDKLLR